VWTIAFVLLGLVLFSALAGFHIGPHAHVLAGTVGLVTAIWFVVMAFDGHSTPLLWTLFGADLVVAGGLGVLGWKGLSTPGRRVSNRVGAALEGVRGSAITELSPDGVVRVNGESWSATSLNGTIHAEHAVQVVQARGVRLEVWGDDGVSDDASGAASSAAPDSRP
jgi:membrane-bound ClpP family serine protease